MRSGVHLVALTVVVALFAFVTVLGFVAARWRRGDLDLLHEWGLAGGRFGTVVTWFLLGGDLYTAYTFIAVPALVFSAGAIGFFAVPYTIIVYPLVFVLMPRLWSVSRAHGYVTPADFVRGRYGSSTLALAVAVAGILATMPYIALQLVGIQVVIAGLGITGTGFMGDLPLIIAFVILAAYTYSSGLRAPAMIALVKDALIFIAVIAAITIIPARLGGYGHIFAAVPTARLLPAPKQYAAYATLALGSALALFLYPHSITGVLSSSGRDVIKRNAAFLPAYSILLGLIALLGFMAVAAGIKPDAVYGAQWAVPALFNMMFPQWFAGVAFAAIAIGALVPAAIMSIATANLFTRNIYREYFRPNATPRQEARVAKAASLVVKFGALAFILALQNARQEAINFQLLGGVWILQTFPAVIFGLYTRWFHRWALLAGWVVGMVSGTAMAASQHFTAIYPLHVGSLAIAGYSAFFALIGNIAVTVLLTLVLDAVGVARGTDETIAADYTGAHVSVLDVARDTERPQSRSGTATA
ncbi:MAG TPA: sodium:solute symporter [Gemmatimonadaceae bacterium]|nr:sodium:solute symporter [Gemmatimonadaceae bacterium]